MGKLIDPHVTVRWGSGCAHALRAGKVPRGSVVTTEGLDAVPSLAEPPCLRDPLTSGGSEGDQEARKCDRVTRGGTGPDHQERGLPLGPGRSWC